MVCAPHRYIVRQMAAAYNPLAERQQSYGRSFAGSYLQTNTDPAVRYSGSDGGTRMQYRQSAAAEENRNYAIKPQRQYDFGAVRTPGIPSGMYAPQKREDRSRAKETKSESTSIDSHLEQSAPSTMYRPMNRFEDYSFAHAQKSWIRLEMQKQSLAQRVIGELEKLENERPMLMQQVS